MTPAAYYALCQAEREEVLDQMLPRQLIEFASDFEDHHEVYVTVRAWRPLMTRLRELASGLLDRVEGPACADPCNSSCACTPCEAAKEKDWTPEQRAKWRAFVGR